MNNAKEKFTHLMKQVQEPYRSEALENFDEEFARRRDWEDVDNPESAISFGFVWSAEQGYDYWDTVIRGLIRKDPVYYCEPEPSCANEGMADLNAELKEQLSEMGDQAIENTNEMLRQHDRICELEQEVERLRGMLSIPLADGGRLQIGDCFTVEDHYPFFSNGYENYNAQLMWDNDIKTMWYAIYRVSDRVSGRACSGSIEDLEGLVFLRREDTRQSAEQAKGGGMSRSKSDRNCLRTMRKKKRAWNTRTLSTGGYSEEDSPQARKDNKRGTHKAERQIAKEDIRQRLEEEGGK